MSSLLQNQCERLAGARYPLHMPGHKRRVPPAPGLSCYAFDLTEIDGADDLHGAAGILAQYFSTEDAQSAPTQENTLIR